MPPVTTSQFPPAVIDHVYSEALEEWYTRFAEEHHLLGIERDVIDAAVWRVYTRESTLDGFLHALEELFGTPERAQAIAIPILGNDFLKIEDYLGVNVPEYIASFGGDPAQFVHEVPMHEVITRVVGVSGVPTNDSVLVKRAEGAAISFFTGVRDRSETMAVCIRSTKVGGVGMAPDTATRFVTALEEALQGFRTAGVALRRDATRSSETSVFHLVNSAKIGLVQPEDEAEIARIRQQMTSPNDARRTIPDALERILALVSVTVGHADLDRRFRSAIESRLRDIRDYQETLDLLTRPASTGGIGLDADRARKLLAAIEQEFRVLHPASGTRRAPVLPSVAPAHSPPFPPPTTAVRAPTAPAAPPIAPSRTPENDDPQPIVHAPPPPPSAAARPSTPPPPPTTKPTEHPVPIVAPHPLPSVVAAPPLRARRAPVVPPPPQRPAAKPIPPFIRPAAPPLAAQPPRPPVPDIRSPAASRPKLHDIRAVPPRLVGPIEELGRLAIEDFRKIAPQPTDAAARILEKLQLLERDSYTKRAEGIRALRSSPLFTTYGTVVNAAFHTSRRIEDEVRDRHAADLRALSVDEYHALRTLNAQLRM